MKTFSRVAIATLMVVGTAGAQPAPAKGAPPAPAPAPAPAKGAKPAAAPAPTPVPAKDAKPAAAPVPAKVDAKPAAAAVPAKADAKPAAAPVPAKDAKPAAAPVPAKADAKLAPKPPDAKPAADKLQPPPEPPLPPEIDALAKTITGTWRCKGDEWDDKGNKSPVTATNKVKLDLDNWWISETLEVKGQRTFKMMAFSTYDKLSRKWRRVAVMNRGGQLIGTSDGLKDAKLTWNLDLISPMGAALFRDSLDASDPKLGLKAGGELSMDRGRTWLKAYEMVCKK